MIERAFEQRIPCAHRLHVGDDQRGHLVGIARIAIVILVARRLGHRGKDLQRIMAGLQPRQIDLSAIRSLEQVALPQQAVRVHVGDIERLLQRLGMRADLVIARRDLVDRILDDARHEHEECDHAEREHGQDDDPNPALHVASPVMPPICLRTIRLLSGHMTRTRISQAVADMDRTGRGYLGDPPRINPVWKIIPVRRFYEIAYARNMRSLATQHTTR